MEAAREEARGLDRSGHAAVIQATLIFLLGFLTAGFMAVLVSPALWRRAVALTRRRFEAALPLSLAEIRADKDAIRAEYAVVARRLEMKIQLLREKLVAQSLEAEHARVETRQVRHELEELVPTRAELEQATQEVARLGEELSRCEQLLGEQEAKLEALEALYDEASFSAASRQIDLVAQEANIARMSEEIDALAAARREDDEKLRDAEQRISEQEHALREERRKGAMLERKNAKLIASLSDADEKLERRKRDLKRLREKAATGGKEDEGVAILRERIQDLAAELVSLTARVEGPESEIHALLAKDQKSVTDAADASGPSLAERIRALQKQAGTDA